MLLSSVAEAMFWTGRYVERAQALARVVLGYERLSFDLPASQALDVTPLFALIGEATTPDPERNRKAALERLVLDADHRSSVLGALIAARENLRVARVVAPVELWTTLSALVQQLKTHSSVTEGSLLEALEATLALGSRFEGERQANMTHDSAYAFLSIGCNIERADMLIRALSVLTPLLLPAGWERVYDDVRWTGLLHALGLHSAYRRHHHHQAERSRLLELALSDVTCPRAVAHCLQAVQRELAHLPAARQVGERLGVALAASLAAGRLGTAALPHEPSVLTEQLGRLSSAISDSYFPREEPVQSPEPKPERLAAADPFGHLLREHEQIDAVLRVLHALTVRVDDGLSVDRTELRTIVSFLADCGELGHHEKEESILTPVLASHGFDWYDGPLARMRTDHLQEHYFIGVLTQLASQVDDWSREDARGFVAVAREFCHFLSAHMGHEQHELFEQASRTLPPDTRANLCRAFEELDARQGPLARESRAALSALIEKYPPVTALRSAS